VQNWFVVVAKELLDVSRPPPRSPILSHGGKIPIFWNVGTLGSDSLLGGRNLEMGVTFSVTAE